MLLEHGQESLAASRQTYLPGMYTAFFVSVTIQLEEREASEESFFFELVFSIFPECGHQRVMDIQLPDALLHIHLIAQYSDSLLKSQACLACCRRKGGEDLPPPSGMQ